MHIKRTSIIVFCLNVTNKLLSINIYLNWGWKISRGNIWMRKKNPIVYWCRYFTCQCQLLRSTLNCLFQERIKQLEFALDDQIVASEDSRQGEQTWFQYLLRNLKFFASWILRMILEDVCVCVCVRARTRLKLVLSLLLECGDSYL